MRAWPRACALPVAEAAQAQRVPRSVQEEAAVPATRAPSIANGGIGRHVGFRCCHLSEGFCKLTIDSGKWTVMEQTVERKKLFVCSSDCEVK